MLCIQENEIAWLITNTLNQLDNVQVVRFKELWLSDLRVKGLFQFQMGEEGSTRELVPLNLDIYSLVILENLAELNFIWKGPTGFLSLQKLQFVCINGCPKLKTIFSTVVVISLPMLQYLDINNCDELEQIFDLGDAHQLKQHVCFPELFHIEVKKCNKLKCLFYNLSATHFTRLINLRIEECSHIHKVFGFEHEADDGGQEETAKKGEQLLLQNLRYITLKKLPNFEEIHHGFKLKEVVLHSIHECPKYSPSLYLHLGKIHMSFSYKPLQCLRIMMLLSQILFYYQVSG